MFSSVFQALYLTAGRARAFFSKPGANRFAAGRPMIATAAAGRPAICQLVIPPRI
jgi:hypothetical protein